MKQFKKYGKLKELKRSLIMDDFVRINSPEDMINFPEIKVKVFTENIYLPELGSYIIVTWNFNESKPSILILSHTLFAALKRWRSNSMQDIIGKTFSIVSKSNNEGVIYHDLYGMGLLPLLSDKIIDEVELYINNTFEFEEN